MGAPSWVETSPMDVDGIHAAEPLRRGAGAHVDANAPRRACRGNGPYADGGPNRELLSHTRIWDRRLFSVTTLCQCVAIVPIDGTGLTLPLPRSSGNVDHARDWGWSHTFITTFSNAGRWGAFGATRNACRALRGRFEPRIPYTRHRICARLRASARARDSRWRAARGGRGTRRASCRHSPTMRR